MSITYEDLLKKVSPKALPPYLTAQSAAPDTATHRLHANPPRASPHRHPPVYPPPSIPSMKSISSISSITRKQCHCEERSDEAISTRTITDGGQPLERYAGTNHSAPRARRINHRPPLARKTAKWLVAPATPPVILSNAKDLLSSHREATPLPTSKEKPSPKRLPNTFSLRLDHRRFNCTSDVYPRCKPQTLRTG